MCPFLLPVLLNKWAPGHLLGKKFLDLDVSAKLTGHRCGFKWLLSFWPPHIHQDSWFLYYPWRPPSHRCPPACPLHRRLRLWCARPRKAMWDLQLLWDYSLCEYLHICLFPSVATFFPSSYNANYYVHALSHSTLLTMMRGRWLYHLRNITCFLPEETYRLGWLTGFPRAHSWWSVKHFRILCLCPVEKFFILLTGFPFLN